jgi:hypothetical protein
MQWQSIYEDSVSISPAKTYFIYKNGIQTDYIHETNDERECIIDIICWSKEMMNKVHIKYSNFDKYGNWTKSYFITEKGKKVRSKRKIQYW